MADGPLVSRSYLSSRGSVSTPPYPLSVSPIRRQECFRQRARIAKLNLLRTFTLNYTKDPLEAEELKPEIFFHKGAYSSASTSARCAILSAARRSLGLPEASAR